MKKLLIPSVIFLVLGMNSCIKAYTCTCTANGKSYINDIAPTTENKAQETCDTYKGYLTEKQGVADLECELK